MVLMSIRGVGLTLGVGIFLSFLNPNSASAICFSSEQCPAGTECRAGYLGIPYCGEIRCNFDRDCPAGFRRCQGGSCQPTGGGGSSGSGTPVPGVGGRCGRIVM